MNMTAFEFYRRLVCFFFGGAYVRTLPTYIGGPVWFHVQTTDTPGEYRWPEPMGFTFTEKSPFVEEIEVFK